MSIRRWISGHTFLIRLMSSTLLVACIPLLILSSLLIQNERNGLMAARSERLAALAFVRTFGLYLENLPDSLYLSEGKYDAAVFAEKVLGAKEDALREYLRSVQAGRGFSTWGDFGDNILYAAPTRYTNRGRVTLFVLSGKTLTESLATLLSGQYVLAEIRDKRLEMACGMLREGDGSVSEIAAQTGFSSPSYFISVFRRQKGMTPIEFRRKHRE